MKKSSLLSLTLASMLSLAMLPLAAEAQMNYQGRLTDASGNPLGDGQYTLEFRIFNAATGGTELWGPFTATSVDLLAGRFNTVLAANDTATPNRALANVLGGTAYLQIKVNSNAPITPRQQILSAPKAMRADVATLANTVASNAIGTTQIADGAITEGKLAGNIGSTLTGVAKLSGNNTYTGNQTITGIQTTTGSVIIDVNGTNTGAVFGSPALVFGGGSSGEGIASKRTAGGNQFGLDFFTGYTSRMSISGSGVSIAGAASIASGNTGRIQVGPNSIDLGDKRIAFGDGTRCTIGEVAGMDDAMSISADRIFIGRGSSAASTIATRAFVEISSAVSFSNPETYRYVKVGSNATDAAGVTRANSIYASDDILAGELRLFSDRRIKKEIHNTDNAADLQTLRAIQISDYQYIDTIAKGSDHQKKVTAQQVEQVYPMAVRQSTDVVPDIYRNAATKEGWVLLATDLKPGERVRLLANKGETVTNVLEVRDGAFRPAQLPEGEDLFVYGREVKDFRTVDYDAISMLNVSATQELARLVKEKDAKIAALEDRLAALEKSLAILAAAEAPGGPVRKETAGR